MNAELTKRLAPPGLHVILGDSAGGIFTRNFGRKNLLVDPDVLSCGPTPRMPLPDEGQWGAMRLASWLEVVPGDPDQRDFFSHGVLDSVPRILEAERINLWHATSVSEQLSVAFTLHVLERAGIDPGRVYLVSFEYQAGGTKLVRALGELNEERMADFPDPVMLSREVAADYRAAWAAMTSDDPWAFERFAVDRPDASVWLKRAMELMLSRFPNKQTGLGHWDEVLLSYASERSTKCAMIVGKTIGNHWEEGDFVGDSWLFGRLLRMADDKLPRPLLHIAGDRTSMRSCEATLTDFGRSILEGRASNHPANPIEDWAAGVKLSSSAGNLWFNDNGRLMRA